MQNGTRKKDEGDPKEQTPPPNQFGQKYKPNIFSTIFLCWMCPVFYKGNKRDIEEEDLIATKKKYQSEIVGDKLERYWIKEINKALRQKRPPKLWKALRDAYWVSYLPGALFVLGQSTARTFQPLLFTRLLSYWSTDNPISQEEAAYYALGMLGCNFLAILFQHHNALFSSRFGMKARVACCSLLYRKVLRMSQTSLGEVEAGQLVNLMSNDAARFDYAFAFMHYIWIVPIQMGVVLYLLYNAAGIAPIIGLVSVTVLVVPIQAALTKFTSVIRRRTALRTDKRIKIMGEIINGIQVIKMYAWEIPFQKVVKALRAHEMDSLSKSIFIRSTFLGFMLFTERTSIFVTVLILILYGNFLTADLIYPIQQYLSIVQMNLALILPIAIASLSEMLVSLDRIQGFLLKDEREDISIMPKAIEGDDVTFNKKTSKTEPIVSKYMRNLSTVQPNELTPRKSEALENDIAVEISGVTASWTPQTDVTTLKNISVRMRRNKLCAIVGPVGSGKTSVLQILLKELAISQGSISVRGSIGYACQESWMFPSTVRENILFGLPYESEKYKEVTRACCLLPDFKQFPYGDQSLVGERGVSLSGGQKARINLARAIYRDADIYLLDDPLSAVDANVGRQLFEGCINGYLKGKTRILVTHQVHFLQNADYIVVLNDGRIEDMGTYSELSTSGQEFSKMLKSLQENNDVEDSTTESAKKRPSFHKNISVLSTKSEDNAKEQEQVMKAEERAKGNLKWSVVWNYFRSVDSILVIVLAFGALMITQVSTTTTDYWISFWTNQVASYLQGLPEDEDPDPGMDVQMGILTTGQYLLVHGCLVLSIIIIAQVRIIGFVVMTMRASARLHDKMFHNLLQAIMRFFDTSSSGRILNRFSKDVGSMDELLPRSLLETIQMYLQVTSVLVLNAIALPWTLIPTVVLIVVFIFLLKYYLNAAQAVKRLEGTTKSPVFSMLNSTLVGMPTIRSSDSQHRLIKQFDNSQNLHSSAFHTYIGGSTAFGLYLDTLCLIYLGIILAIFILIDFDGLIPVGNVGLAVTQSMVLTMLLQMAARFTADFIGQMTAVERVLEYTNLPEETNLTEGSTKPDKNWPQTGEMEFRNVFMRYTAENPYVLNNLNFTIKNKWKVGVVGRTGAGKSSLISALFRLSDIEGSVLIDGLDTIGLPKRELRSKISIIPQEPVLFSATLRYNLDPFDHYSDEDIWKSLEQVELKDAIPALDYKVAEGGSNFSIGQRQLLCLARAILRSNKILIMDEATANVDPQTDALIQKTIRREFANCTVLTIAHRLNTIMDSDRVLVMDKGIAAEFDHPYILLNKPNSIFTFMVNETGENMKKTLFEMAQTKYNDGTSNEEQLPLTRSHQE